MNICIEGCDNSGKTTLASELSQVYDRQVVHAARLETPEAMTEVFENEVDTCGRLILDRSQAISGHIYDTVIRKCEPQFGLDDIAVVAQDTLLIVCLPPKELVTADNGRFHMGGVNENLSALYDKYNELFGEGHMEGNTVFVFDYTKHNLGDVIDWITDMVGGPIF